MQTTSNTSRDVEVSTRDRLRIQARWWRVERPRGTVVVAHGLGEHGGTYAQLAATVGGMLDLDFVALDFRGLGDSPGRLGVVQEGALADLLVIDGDPVADIALITDPAKNMLVIMKNGEIFKNTLPN